MPAKKKEEKKESSKIQFFGDQGGIKSDMPAWYLERHVEFAEDSIRRKQKMLDRGGIEADQVPRVKEEIKAEKAKLKQIVESKPNLTGAQKDRCAKAYENLQRQIKDSMPTRKDAKDGLVSPYDELRRLKSKHITIDPTIAKACGVKPDHGKISGDEANKCYQIIGKILGENTNTERLRRDGNTEAYRTMDDLTQAIHGAIFKGEKLEGV
jgi:tellurite resistance protein